MGLIRETCSFFRSIYEGSKRLKVAERVEIYEAIFDYMFYDIEPDSEKVKPTTLLAFMSNRMAFDNAKARYDKSVEAGERGREYGYLGAEHGKKGGRPKKNSCLGEEKSPKNPQITPDGGFQKPSKTPQEIEIDYNVSKYEKKEINNTSTACACTREGLESYQEVLNNNGVSEGLQHYFWKFIKHCQLNGRKVTNDKLIDIIVRLDIQHGTDDAAKGRSLNRAVNKGYFDIAEEV